MDVALALFHAFAFLSLVSAIAMVAFVRHIVAGAMSLVVTLISTAGIYVLLSAELVAAIQILVYAGATLVLFLFVIMLLNLRTDVFGPTRAGPLVVKALGAFGAAAVAAVLGYRLPSALGALQSPPLPGAGFGGHRQLGIALYSDYVVPVEITGLVLLAAIVGAIVVAKRRID